MTRSAEGRRFSIPEMRAVDRSGSGRSCPTLSPMASNNKNERLMEAATFPLFEKTRAVRVAGTDRSRLSRVRGIGARHQGRLTSKRGVRI